MVFAILCLASCSGGTGGGPGTEEPAPAPAEPDAAEADETSPGPGQDASSAVPPAPEPAPEPEPAPTVEIQWSEPFVPGKNDELPAKWTRCKKDSDCWSLETDCCDHASVNEKWAEKAREKLPMTMCDMVCPMESIRAVCLEGRCGLQVGSSPGFTDTF